jgi:hypothetical protein
VREYSQSTLARDEDGRMSKKQSSMFANKGVDKVEVCFREWLKMRRKLNKLQASLV